MKLGIKYVSFRCRLVGIRINKTTLNRLRNGYSVRWDKYCAIKCLIMDGVGYFRFGFPVVGNKLGDGLIFVDSVTKVHRVKFRDDGWVMRYVTNRKVYNSYIDYVEDPNDPDKLLKVEENNLPYLVGEYFREFWISGSWFDSAPVLLRYDNSLNIVSELAGNKKWLGLSKLVNSVDFNCLLRSYNISVDDWNKGKKGLMLPYLTIQRLSAMMMRVYIISEFEGLDWLNFGQYEIYTISGDNRFLIYGENCRLVCENIDNPEVKGLYTLAGSFVEIDKYAYIFLNAEIKYLVCGYRTK